jgi:hypothetical protein
VLLVVPRNAKLFIYTDSENTIKHMMDKQTTICNARHLFKENNNLSWEIIREIININNLDLQLIKVKAHSDNVNNNMVDKLARDAHYNNIPLLQLKSNSLDLVNAYPLWNGIRIENGLRAFITKLSRVFGFERWINLNRNRKYQFIDIDWKATFNLLNDVNITYETNYTYSSRKRNRLKLLLEEIPTIQHMIKRRPDLYKNWKCPMCNKEKETFNHVFLCRQQRIRMSQIIELAKNELIYIMTEEIDKSLSKSDINIDIDKIWYNEYSKDEITFIDIIKGIVPKSLSECIKLYIKKDEDIQQILELFYHRIQDYWKMVWEIRCDKLIFKEKEEGITSQEKKKKFKGRRINSCSKNNEYSIDYKFINYLLTLELQMGGSYLNYTYSYF